MPGLLIYIISLILFLQDNNWSEFQILLYAISCRICKMSPVPARMYK